jgi:hypothetical protein
MNVLLQLWLPILLSAVFIFVASSFIHMLFKWHNSEYHKFDNEDELRAAFNKRGAPKPGIYFLPYANDPKQMQQEETLRKFTEGPVAKIIIRRTGMPSIGKSLLLWFLMSLLIAAIAGCAAFCAVGAGNAHRGAHVVGIITLLAYGVGSVMQGIWWGAPWRSVLKDLLDAIIYAVVSTLTFAWLWP